MPRTARSSVGGICYHIINCGNGRAQVFHDDADYAGFVELLENGSERFRMRVLGYCLMPNHFHLVLWPREDLDLSRFMQWVMTSHVRRHYRRRRTSGHVWQGRFKAFPIQQDEHLLTVLAYVERNPLRAQLVRRAKEWVWSSVPAFTSRSRPTFLVQGPVDRPRRWLAEIHRDETGSLAVVQTSLNRGTPFGSSGWTRRIAERLGLESSLRPRGRPRLKSVK